MPTTAHEPRLRTRRRAATALLFALPLMLSACGGEDDEAAPRQAYTPDSETTAAEEPNTGQSPSQSTGPPTESSPASDSESADEEADTASSADCAGRQFLLTDVSDLTCGEALGMLDPFVTSAQEGGRISDVRCTVGTGEFQGKTRDEWSCSRDEGGSFTAYSR